MILKNTRLTNLLFCFFPLFAFSSFAFAGSVRLPQTAKAATSSAGDDGDIRPLCNCRPRDFHPAEPAA